jgi:Ca2+-binding RTX toxin-like protein
MALIDGDGSNNVLVGTIFGDTIRGFGGNDVLIGLAGNDQLKGGSEADTVDGGSGNDSLFGEDGSDVLRGGSGNDLLLGGNGDDVLNGGTGADDMRGESGNDTYWVDNAGDIVTELALSGTDVITSSIFSTSLDIGGRLDVENLTLIGDAFRGIGNAQNNVITGNNLDNVLSGLAGNDSLIGLGGNDFLLAGSGNDLLLGGDGNDTLIGGPGRDIMAGGAGNDMFRFIATSHSVVGVADAITEFDDFGDDTINVSELFDPTMKYLHNGAFTDPGQVRINDIAGPDVLVEVNTVGTSGADFAVRLIGTSLDSMTAGDFSL